MSPAQPSTPLPQGFDIPVSDWQRTPTAVQDEVLSLLKWNGYCRFARRVASGVVRLSPAGGSGEMSVQRDHS